MELIEALRKRHSVRRFTGKRIEGEVKEKLERVIAECIRESGLSIQLFLDDTSAFAGLITAYGKLQNARSFLALVGRKGSGLEEACGYYGQKIVLEAQRLGLNTCWTGFAYNKRRTSARIALSEKLVVVIAIGYGATQGVPHKSKPIERLYKCEREMPDWFRRGMQAAILAPTAANQQQFLFTLKGNTVFASPGEGPLSKVDLGIAKYNFEIGAGEGDWKWA